MAQKLRALAVGIVAVALAGCWYQPGQGPDRSAYNPFETEINTATVTDLTEQWTAPTDDGGVSDPVVSNAGVHVSAGQLSYYGFDPATGARLWRHDVPSEGVVTLTSQPFADAGTLLIGYGRGNLGGSYTLERLDAATGGSLGIVDGYGYLNGQRGSRMVQHRVGFGSGGPVATSLKVSDSEDPNVGWEGLIHVTQNTSAAAVTLAPTRVYQAGNGIVSMTDPASPTIGNGVRAWPLSGVAHCGPGNVITCPMWARPLDGTGSTVPVLNGDQSVLYTATNAGTVYAVNALDGAVLWTASLGSPASRTPALAEGVLYVPTADGRLVAVDADGCGAATCAPLWSATGSAGSFISDQPAVAGGVVFTGWSDGAVRAYPAAGCGAATCSPVWSASTGSNITGAPAVSGGQLYVGTQDGRLIAYGLD